jgi:hypothetical protein
MKRTMQIEESGPSLNPEWAITFIGDPTVQPIRTYDDPLHAMYDAAAWCRGEMPQHGEEVPA